MDWIKRNKERVDVICDAESSFQPTLRKMWDFADELVRMSYKVEKDGPVFMGGSDYQAADLRAWANDLRRATRLASRLGYDHAGTPVRPHPVS